MIAYFLICQVSFHNVILWTRPPCSTYVIRTTRFNWRPDVASFLRACIQNIEASPWMFVGVRVCVRACVQACVRACVRACDKLGCFGCLLIKKISCSVKSTPVYLSLSLSVCLSVCLSLSLTHARTHAHTLTHTHTHTTTSF